VADGDPQARPALLTPVLDPKPWGGRRLEEWGIALPDADPIGEAHLAAPDAAVACGPLRGRTLGELARADPAAWVGSRGLRVTGGRAVFPLLIKLIASETDLSIQVHPDDRAAGAAGLGTGKTEAYHILAADPGSGLYLGLLPDAPVDAFRYACRRADGSAAAMLRRVPVSPGMTFLIPAGTVHAPGAGITLYEIQQPSNVTFRLDDWGRVDGAGLPRALHHDDGFAVLDPLPRPEPMPRLGPPAWPRGRELLVATPFFALERVRPHGVTAFELPAIDAPQVLTCLEGTIGVEAAGRVLECARGQTAVVPAGCATRLLGATGGLALRGWVPDLELEIVAAARAVGVGAGTLRDLGVELSAP
jgi:mannose-6-phosphate isomerase